MNTTHKYGITQGKIVLDLMERYYKSLPELGSTGAANEVMAIASRMHTNFARTTLAIGIAERSDAWTALQANAGTYSQAVTQALSLSGRKAQDLSKSMELSPLALPVGPAQVYTPVTSREQLKQILQSEPELFDRLDQDGRKLSVAAKVRQIIADTPSYLVDECIRIAQDASHDSVKPHQKMKLIVDGEARWVKAHAHANMTHLLGTSTNTWRLLNGMNNFVQSSLKLTHRYAESALWWSEVAPAKQPVIEHGETDDGYAGGEDSFLTSPMKTYTIDGQWGRMDQWQAKEDAKQEMVWDFQSAAIEADELLTAISELLEAADLEVIYAWQYIAEAVFIPMTDRTAAEDMLLQSTIDYREKQVAKGLDLDADHMEQYGLVPTILSQFDDETSAKIVALRKEFGHE